MNRTKLSLIAMVAGAVVVMASALGARGAGIDDIVRDVLRNRASPGQPVVISNGQNVTSLDGYAGSETLFMILVPQGQTELTVRTSGGRGDVDLYAQFSAAPTLSVFAHRSTGRTTDETVSVPKPQAGWWYVMLDGSSNYSGVTLSASFAPDPVPLSPPAAVRSPLAAGELPRGVLRLVPGQTVAGLAGRAGMRKRYQILVPPRAESLSVTTAGGSGDCNLYLSRGARPDAKNHEFVSQGEGTQEKISVEKPAAGPWYVLLYGNKPFDGVSLSVSVTGGAVNRGAQGGRLEVVAPEPGSVIRAGATYVVKWRTPVLAGRLRVLESYDDGQTWSDIAPASVADIRKGEIRWTVPFSIWGRGGKTIHLRVIGMDDPQLVADAGPYEVVRKGPVRPAPAATTGPASRPAKE